MVFMLRRSLLSKNHLKLIHPFSSTESIKISSDFVKTKSTVDAEDVKHLSKYSKEWWNVDGKFHPLHALNKIRVQFIRDGLANLAYREMNPVKPLENIKILDVGCGGGILSEPLARIGAEVTGLDASQELISVAKEHAALDNEISSKINYIHSTIEDIALKEKEAFDVIVASEILEHVSDQKLFLKCCTNTLKPGGSIFITTINKTLLSWLGGIIAAEYLLRIVPTGTHEWNKFISPNETRRILEDYGCKTKLIHGMFYNFLTGEWSWISSTAISYALHAVKSEISQV